MGKTVNEALRDLFLAHGGDVSDLEDNKSLSDFIADVSTVIGSNATGSITPVVESGTKIADYTLNGVEGSLYAPAVAPELPDATELEDGVVLAVVNGAWAPCTISAEENSETGDIDVTLTPVVPDSET